MAAITVASNYPIRTSVGDLTMHIVRSTSVADGDTYASGLGSAVVAYWANGETDEGTAGDEGINVANSSGTFTFYLKTTGAVNLFILSRS